MTPTLTTDTHRGKVADALAKDVWMNCHDVAQILDWSADSASKVLSDNHRAENINRRKTNNPDDPPYEYQLKDTIRIEPAD
jgi:hypothetical protein